MVVRPRLVYPPAVSGPAAQEPPRLHHQVMPAPGFQLRPWTKMIARLGGRRRRNDQPHLHRLLLEQFHVGQRLCLALARARANQRRYDALRGALGQRTGARQFDVMLMRKRRYHRQVPEEGRVRRLNSRRRSASGLQGGGRLWLLLGGFEIRQRFLWNEEDAPSLAEGVEGQRVLFHRMQHSGEFGTVQFEESAHGAGLGAATPFAQPFIEVAQARLDLRQRVTHRLGLREIFSDGRADLAPRIVRLKRQPEAPADLIEIALAIGHQQLIQRFI